MGFGQCKDLTLEGSSLSELLPLLVKGGRGGSSLKSHPPTLHDMCHPHVDEGVGGPCLLLHAAGLGLLVAPIIARKRRELLEC